MKLTCGTFYTIAEFYAPAVLLANLDSKFARLAATQGILPPVPLPGCEGTEGGNGHGGHTVTRSGRV